LILLLSSEAMLDQRARRILVFDLPVDLGQMNQHGQAIFVQAQLVLRLAVGVNTRQVDQQRRAARSGLAERSQARRGGERLMQCEWSRLQAVGRQRRAG
jgi:hypothetical protein